MIDVTKLNLFPKTVNEISVPINKKHNVIFYSENSTFLEIYNLLKIKRIFVKKISFPFSKSPHLIIDSQIQKNYKNLGLVTVKNIEELKENVFIDSSYFLDLVDKRYGKDSYKRSLVLSKIIEYLNMCRSDDSENILIYHVDLSQDLDPRPMYKRSWVLLTMADAGNGRFPFDYVVVCFTLNNKARYFSIYNKSMKSFQYSKIYNIFKAIKKGKVIEKEEDLETEDKEEEKKPEVIKEPIKEFEPDELRNEDMLGKNNGSSSQLEEAIKSFDIDDVRNEDMLGDSKFVSTHDLIKQIKENQQIQESNKTFSNTSKILQRILKE